MIRHAIICLLAAVFAFASGLVAAAQPRSINDCDSIKDGDAYNKCLASFGPKRGHSASSKTANIPAATDTGARRARPTGTRKANRNKSKRPMSALERRYQRGEAYHARNRLYTIRRSGGRVRTIIHLRNGRR